MLSEALELDGLPGYPVLDVPRCDVSRLAHPQVLQQLGKGHRQATSRPQRVLLIDVVQVDLE